MICEDDLVGDIEGDDELEALSSPDEILRTSLCWSLDLGLKIDLEAIGVSGVVNGVGNPEDPRLQLTSPFSDNCGLEGVEVLILLEAKFLIMDMRESALEIF